MSFLLLPAPKVSVRWMRWSLEGRLLNQTFKTWVRGQSPLAGRHQYCDHV